MTGGSAGAKRPGGFVLGKGVPQAPPKKVPKAAALITDDGTLPPPPAGTLAKFTEPCGLWMAVDIETHELIPNTKDQGWVTGQFGHSCRIDRPCIADLRIVQLGWCVGRFSSTALPVVKSTLVKPEGFTISAAATAKHRITQEGAATDGKPLAAALREMLDDAFAVARDGGRICAHQTALAAAPSREDLSCNWVGRLFVLTGRDCAVGVRCGRRRPGDAAG